MKNNETQESNDLTFDDNNKKVQDATQDDYVEPRKSMFKASTKKKIQLSFENVIIKSIPKQRRCCKGNLPPPEPRTIIDNVSGTFTPG